MTKAIGYGLVTVMAAAAAYSAYSSLPVPKPAKPAAQTAELSKADQKFIADMNVSNAAVTGKQDTYDLKAVQATRSSLFGKNSYRQICDHKLGDFTFSAKGTEAMQLSVEGVQCRRGISTMRLNVMMAAQSDTIYRSVYVRTENIKNARPRISSFDPTVGGLSF